MKKIYTITLDDDVPLSGNIGSDIREIAFWIYEELSKFSEPILCMDDDRDISNSGLIKNELYDISFEGKYIYKFTSDMKNVDKRMYEPFVLNDTSFGFTVYDGSISDTEVAIILENILKLLKFNYKFNIDSIVYNDSKKANRLLAINEIMNKKEMIQASSKKRVKVRLKPILSVLGF